MEVFDVTIPEEKKEELASPEVELSYAKKKQDAAVLYDPTNRIYATYLNEGSDSNTIDVDLLDQYAVSPQSDLTKTRAIINICRVYVNKNDIIGLTVEAIENNINTEVRLSYRSPQKGVARKSDIEKAKELVADFNKKINIRDLITRTILTTFVDGTFIAYLRKIEKGDEFDYTVDFYPVGTAIISDYDIAGEPCVLIDMNTLRGALQKTYQKTRKRKAVFFDNIEQEIKETYPDEVYRAYKDNEAYAKLNVENSGVVRVNRQNKKYGLSCIFRSLYPILMLEAFDAADRSNAKARAKKIIAQIMNKEILGPDYDRDAYADMAFAHQNLLDSWKQKTVVTTAPPHVKEITYVEPSVEMTNIETVNYYRQRAMSTLGITFLMDTKGTSMGVANISLKQLMKRINKISTQLEAILVKWYRIMLRDNGLDPALAPTVSIIDSEMTEMNMKLDLVNTLFGKLNCSYETAFETLGLSLEDEKIRREKENEEQLEMTFAPRLTPYTVSGNSSGGSTASGWRPGYKAPTFNSNTDGHGGGRPADQNTETPDKQAYDQMYYENKVNGAG